MRIELITASHAKIMSNLMFKILFLFSDKDSVLLGVLWGAQIDNMGFKSAPQDNNIKSLIKIIRMLFFLRKSCSRPILTFSLI